MEEAIEPKAVELDAPKESEVKTQKAWYLSKLIWLGVIQFLIGTLTLLAEFLQKGDYSPNAVTLLFVGWLTIVTRVYFTDTGIQR